MRRRGTVKKRGGTRTAMKHIRNSAQRKIASAWRHKMNTAARKSRKAPSFANLAVRYGLPQTYMPPGAKYVLDPTLQPDTSVYKWLQFKDEIMHTPIYLIVCHAGICNTPVQCKTPGILPKDKSPTFTIPKSTYIMNLTAGGEKCIVRFIFILLIAQFRNEFKKFLLVDSKADITVGYDENGSPLFSQGYRATEVDYPNMFCTFRDKNPSFSQYMGVFDLGKIAHKKFSDINNIDDSLIQTMEPGLYGNDHWYLSEVIEETYKRTRTTSGIFIFMGCTVPIRENGSEESRDTISQAQTLIYEGDLKYNSIKPTLDAGSLKGHGFYEDIPTDGGVTQRINVASNTEKAALANAGMNLSTVKCQS